MRINKLLVTLAFSMLFVNGTAIAADFSKGIQAYQSGNFNTALTELTPLAEEGNVVSQFHVGQMYASGDGALENDKVALEWFILSAEQGYIKAQTHLGDMYFGGDGVPKNFKTSLRWYSLAAEQGDAIAQINIGMMHELGKGPVKDSLSAYMWYSLAAYNGQELGAVHKEVIAEKLTHAQVSKAQQMSATCLASDYKNCWGHQLAEVQKALDRQRAKQKAQEKAREDKAAADRKALSSAIQYIVDEIRQRWIRPGNAHNGMAVELVIRLTHTGEIVQVKVSSRDDSTTDAFVRSVVRAVRKVRQFDKLSQLSPELFDANFRKFTVRFKPEDLR